MENSIGILLSIIFLFLSGIHVYWALGGKWGFAAAIPTTEGQPDFRPGAFLTLLVALVLMAMEGFAFVLAFDPPSIEVNEAWLRWGGLILAGIFALRAIGDFKRVGLFKPQNGSSFARLDTRLYSPLCLFISLAFLYLTLSK